MFLLTVAGGEYEDSWENPVYVSHSKERLDKIKAKFEEEYNSMQEISDELMERYDALSEKFPRPEWNNEVDEDDYYFAEYQWHAKYWHPLYLAMLSSRGILYPLTDWLPEGYEIRPERVFYNIEEVKEI